MRSHQNKRTRPRVTASFYGLRFLQDLALPWCIPSKSLTTLHPTLVAKTNLDYLEWVDSGIDQKYGSSVYLPSVDLVNGAAIHWTVDSDWLHVAVAARATGWIGIGISEAGGMIGSDMALYTAASRPKDIVDAYVTENRFPVEDECQQDWIFEEPTSETSATTAFELGLLTFEARRKLDTGDAQDKPILRDDDPTFPAHRIIAAWGDSPEVNYHGSNVARGSVRFFGSIDEDAAFQENMDTNAEGSFVVLANNYTIAEDEETQYIDFCATRADLIEQGVPNSTDTLSVVGFRPILSPESAPYVHHFVVSASIDSTKNACEDDLDNLVYVWAPGDGPFALPDFLGSPLFGENGFQSFTMEVHYNNPGFVQGIVDNSGVEFFYTSVPREMEMGVLQIGDPFLNLFGTPVGEGLSFHSFTCSGDCSSTFLSEPVTVVREYLHMHGTGTRMTNEQLRNGEVVRNSSVEVWEFDQNGNVPIQQQPFQIFPGDSFRTNCYYRGKADTTFGLGSQEEMCIVFVYYYPLKRIAVDGVGDIPWHCGYDDPGFEACFVEYDSFPLTKDDQLNRLFGGQQCSPLEEETGNISNGSLPSFILMPSVAAFFLAFFQIW